MLNYWRHSVVQTLQYNITNLNGLTIEFHASVIRLEISILVAQFSDGARSGYLTAESRTVAEMSVRKVIISRSISDFDTTTTTVTRVGKLNTPDRTLPRCTRKMISGKWMSHLLRGRDWAIPGAAAASHG